jgi:hypothetical protein
VGGRCWRGDRAGTEWPERNEEWATKLSNSRRASLGLTVVNATNDSQTIFLSDEEYVIETVVAIVKVKSVDLQNGDLSTNTTSETVLRSYMLTV